LNRINDIDGFGECLIAVAAAVEAAAAECSKDAGDEQHEHECSPGCEGGPQLAADDGAKVGDGVEQGGIGAEISFEDVGGGDPFGAAERLVKEH